eukprot:695749-Amphidinium_carterae.2
MQPRLAALEETCEITGCESSLRRFFFPTRCIVGLAHGPSENPPVNNNILAPPLLLHHRAQSPRDPTTSTEPTMFIKMA